jgi:hypothetical protein
VPSVHNYLLEILSFLELIKVYDGIASFRHHSYKLISVPRHTSVEQLVAAAMWAFHLTGDPGKFYFMYF